MTDPVRPLIKTLNNGDNAEQKISSFILQRQRTNPDLMTDTIKVFKRHAQKTIRRNKFNVIHTAKTTHTSYTYELYHKDFYTYIAERRQLKVKNILKDIANRTHIT